MKLSAIVPVHNDPNHLRRCLEALRSGRRRPDEIIVVDDASTDASADVACGLGARVISLAGASHGPALARNRGAAAAQGYPLKAGQFDPGSAGVPAGLRASAPVNSRQDANAPR